MRALFWLLMALLLAVAVLLLSRDYGSYVVVVLPQWKIEMTASLAILFLLALVFLAHLLLRFIQHLSHMPAKARLYRTRRRLDLYHQWLESAILSLMAGRFRDGLNQAERANELAVEPRQQAVTSLVAALAGQYLMDEDKSQVWLNRARELDRYTQLPRTICEAESLMKFHKPQEALRVLEGIRRKRWNLSAQRVALRAYQELGQWPKVLRLVRRLEQQGEYNRVPMMPLVRHAHRRALEQLAAEEKDIQDYWNKIPAAEQQDSEVVAAAARVFSARGEEASARTLILNALQNEWSSALARQWGECSSEEAVLRLPQAEKWLDTHPRDAGLQHALGRLCLKLQLWGKALHFLENAIAVEPTPQLHLELGHLQDQLDNKEAARQHYRAALNIPPSLH